MFSPSPLIPQIPLNNQLPTPCIICGQNLIDAKNHLHNHFKSIQIFNCAFCSNVFDKFSTFFTHITENSCKPNILFQCNLCSKTFCNIDELHSHIRRTYLKDVKNYSCRFCGELCETVNCVQRHCLENHPNEYESLFACNRGCSAPYASGYDLLQDDWKHVYGVLVDVKMDSMPNRQYECNLCLKKFTRMHDLTMHSRTHQSLPVFNCSFCNKMFVDSKNFMTHLRKTHKVEDAFKDLKNLDDYVLTSKKSPGDSLKDQKVFFKKYQCSLCKLNFVNKSTIEMHYKRIHKKDLYSISEIDKNVKIVSILNKKFYDCPICHDSNLIGKFSFVQHLHKNHNGENPFKCSICKMIFNHPKLLLNHIIQHFQHRFKCNSCTMTFNLKSSLNRHTSIHNGTFKCPKCSISFTTQISLDKHSRIHSDGKPHKCDYCDKAFSQSSDKTKHMRIHSGDKPYKCTVCGKTFTYLTSHRNHSLTHNAKELRPYQCTHCGKSFQQLYNLKVHSRIHTGERPHACGDCGKAFKTAGTLAEHRKIHANIRDYKCDACGKMFVHQSSFQKHQRMHAGEKRFSCAVCDRKFGQAAHLKGHMLGHTGERPFNCHLCEKSFLRKDAMKNHLLIHVKQKEAAEGKV